ncbi:hypothetical protein [Paenibacillus mucilaginosus]|uniref:Uncharacterized protein n=3 Tax=Paenibacillus mucilaginosus TaxID=61624 RepID=H6NN54_9BACL|nr:hypothetical protein [Paenibacillus mucilaginosus]AEI44178.1 hypothetical protein KNP414_05654 [Paenibacillus mucilaginosus KNP414]AFC31730.1 hypothetical protein PM3016_4998 [Paenibacillus mucilaginosus 3016]AFH64082.1 hypothetical protein B2K_25920 [Paenibacillus mucilaginosus K02]MCG7212362.1 hypothetical protein [Paenibacillus mucilaginosus]WDM25594.1 hypothetical protein KCX80_24500 [Paenibacillus mucilaginosus]
MQSTMQSKTQSTNITFGNNSILVRLIGTDRGRIPSLLSALRHNKLTWSSLRKPPVRIDLYDEEAMLFTPDGDKYRLPIF